MIASVRRVTRLAAGVAIICLLGSVAGPAAAEDRPFVPGGIADKPFLATSGGGARLGGYTDTQLRWAREAGLTQELTFQMRRFNLFVHAPVSDRLRVAAEIEFEDGGEEIVLEAALVDFEVHPSLTFRAGIILSPLGRFNLAHDSPANVLTERPLVATEITGSALSEAGMGVYGAYYPTAASRITYEVYAVNGYDDGVVLGDPAGTRIPAGRGNHEDSNHRPSFVGRIACSPRPAGELGLSLHHGPYNVWDLDGLRVDARRNLTMLAVDGDVRWRRLEIQGELVEASIDVPAASALLADSQRGFYLQGVARFGEGRIANLPGSSFAGVVRWEAVDFDTAADGDDVRRVTLGLNFRPIEDAVFKLDYLRSRERDGFANEVEAAAVLFSLASYF